MELLWFLTTLLSATSLYLWLRTKELKKEIAMDKDEIKMWQNSYTQLKKLYDSHVRYSQRNENC